eukprot:ANDGO_03400.mRNA.1 26S proteasome regulatory subunit RPN14
MLRDVRVQSNWNTVDKAWYYVSCGVPFERESRTKREDWFSATGGGPPASMKVGADGAEGEVEVEVRPQGSLLSIRFPEAQCASVPIEPRTFEFLLPERTLSGTFGTGVTCFDVSDDASKLLVGHADGSVALHEASAGSLIKSFSKMQYNGAEVDVTVCKFFPSGQVVLTAGLDTRIVVTRLDDGFQGAVLQGVHSARVTDAVFVERGRNVLSCAADGSVALWECGSAKDVWCLNKSIGGQRASEDSLPVATCCTLLTGVTEEKAEIRPVAGNPALHFGTSGSSAAVGFENGNVILVDLRSKVVYARLKVQAAAVRGVGVVSHGSALRIVHENGAVADIELRSLQMPSPSVTLMDPFLSSSAVRSIAGDWIGTNDGAVLCLRTSVRAHSRYLIGTEHYEVFALKENVSTGTVWTCARDNCIRKYRLDSFTQ